MSIKRAERENKNEYAFESVNATTIVRVVCEVGVGEVQQNSNKYMCNVLHKFMCVCTCVYYRKILWQKLKRHLWHYSILIYLMST